MIILLDIDGVLVTTPSWRAVELEPDGFLKFNESAAINLSKIVNETNADIILTTTHRINYTNEEWVKLLHSRMIYPKSVNKLNEITTLSEMADRITEIIEWANRQSPPTQYIIIDDDNSLHNLPARIKNRWVATKPMIGLDGEATERAFNIIKGQH